MKVITAIKNRRSVRKYNNKVPKDSDIKKILDAGVWAPSGLNNQPWKFKIIRNETEKEGLAKFTEYGSIIKKSPIAICVFLDRKVMYNRTKDLLAIGACIQNMLLRAHELGLATCWLGEILNKRSKVEKYLETGSEFELVAVITLGYARIKPRGYRKSLNRFILK